MKVLIILGALLLGFILLVAIIGAFLPRTHKATRSARYKRNPEEVYAAISDLATQPSWRRDLVGIDVLPSRGGQTSFREHFRHRAITYIVREDLAPTRRVTQIADEHLPFAGTWTFAILAEQNGSRLQITEDGEIKNVLFRFLARYVFGYEGTADAYLRDLGKHFGETVTPQP